jgi:primosomal replication protein N''
MGYAEMSDLVRLCPQCGSERSPSEALCQNEVHGSLCSWPLTGEAVTVRGQKPEPTLSEQPMAARCPNGHSVDVGDLLCSQCGAAINDQQSSTGTACAPDEVALPTEIDGWSVVSSVPQQTGPWSKYLVEREPGEQAVLNLYEYGAEPDQAVYSVLRKMDTDHIPALLATGRFDDRAYEVTEYLPGGSLSEAGDLIDAPELFHRVVDEIGRALDSFANLSLRHRDLSPRSVLVRSREPLDLVITGFGSARLSDFDLESVAPLEITRYSSPESIVGGVSAASDWWSLGVILLELLTKGDCFAGVHDKAFQIHVVTRGIAIPEELEDRQKQLLKGLLARDPLKRWRWPQVRSWLAGEQVEAPEPQIHPDTRNGPPIALGAAKYYRPENYALAASEAQNWTAGCSNFSSGALATWLEEREADPMLVSAVRRLASDEDLNEDCRNALALMLLNPALPLSLRGEIVTPAWLLANLEEAYNLVTGPLTRHLERMGRELWLVRMRVRAELVRNRAKLLEIDLDEDRVRIAVLASSRSNLEVERATIRAVYPDSNHGGLASLIESDRLSEEELIILISAKLSQFTPMEALVDNTKELANQFSIGRPDDAVVRALFVRPRREIYSEIDTRIAGFSSCPLAKINEWAESFRVERRIPLSRAALILTVPQEEWREPPKQQYIANLLQHFEKRVTRSVQRGPLVRFTIGKSTSRVDLFELSSALQSAQAVLEHLLRRSAVPISVDASAFGGNEGLQTRFRRLVSHATTFKRDTGIDGRYLAFPFLLVRDPRLVSTGAKIRIAPILLWPVTFETATARSGVASIAFDQEREEVRLSPALEGMLGEVEAKKWQGVKDDLLGRSSIRCSDVIDAFGELATPTSRVLAPLPHKDFRLSKQEMHVACSAAFFNAEFTGQFIAEDLRSLARRPPKDTALEAALRVGASNTEPSRTTENLQRIENFATIEFDPSQEGAVAKARVAPGVLVEGPPGTGKSQTIVNIVSDCIGRGETALVVCQKQAALRVVQKRLEAEGLSDRIFAVLDSSKDREPILRALRDQLPIVQGTSSGDIVSLRKSRAAVAARIVAVENEINRHHQSIYRVDDITGLSYRAIVSELIALDASRTPIEVPRLRANLGRLGQEELAEVEEACAALGPLWLRSKFEGSPLVSLKQFTADDAISNEIANLVSDFSRAEDSRAVVLETHVTPYEINEPGPYRKWLDRYAPLFMNMAEGVRRDSSRWLDLFKITETGRASGRELIERLKVIRQQLGRLSRNEVDYATMAAAKKLSDDQLMRMSTSSTGALIGESFLSRLSIRRAINRHRCLKFLAGVGKAATLQSLQLLRDAISMEESLRPIRNAVQQVRTALALSQESADLLLTSDVEEEVEVLLRHLEPVAEAADAAAAAPEPCVESVERLLRSGQAGGFEVLKANIEAAIVRWAARERSKTALNALDPWFSGSWIQERIVEISGNLAPTGSINLLAEAIPTLVAYQRFRARSAELRPLALQVFSSLRAFSEKLEQLDEEDVVAAVRHTIRREAYLAWAARLTTSDPVLTVQPTELQRKVSSLAQLDVELRELNKKYLANGVDRGSIATTAQWETITRLRGPRKRQLREIVDQGGDMGLFRMRPVWLMTPDLVSRVLPLRPAHFDAVIFDEASQLLVEHAVPSLFRAKRVIVAGDEKQMPPSSFFSSRTGSDEDDELDEELDDTATDTERDVAEETWNRREIKDCPDLLALGRSFLPTAPLQVHYRSQFRELISFSNAAFYKGGLSVPVRHPDREIARIRPIEVIRADGVYDSQSNLVEAERVVDVLSEYWRLPPGECPSIGVVTFNLKQADLVEERIQIRAAGDPKFMQVYSRECERMRNGEDVGFFVKNVENVQGDERDVIIFSTTFGPNSHGGFRRNFGALGQVGGERRLNVAITRSRQKIVIITSMPINDISDALAIGRPPAKPRDYLQGYIDFASKISSGDLEAARSAVSRVGSTNQRIGQGKRQDGFVAAVSRYLRELGHDAVSSTTDDAFAIDLAVEDPKTGLFGLAIECDSPLDVLGRLETARSREIWRPSVLRRAIPFVHRVSSQAWYFDGESEKARLRAAVETAIQRVAP